jgi:hypothetical protein
LPKLEGTFSLVIRGARRKESIVSTDSFIDAVIHLKILFLFRRGEICEIVPTIEPRSAFASSLERFGPRRGTAGSGFWDMP